MNDPQRLAFLIGLRRARRRAPRAPRAGCRTRPTGSASGRTSRRGGARPARGRGRGCTRARGSTPRRRARSRTPGTMFECTSTDCSRPSSMNWLTASRLRARCGCMRLTTKLPDEAFGAVGRGDEDLRHAALADAFEQPVASQRHARARGRCQAAAAQPRLGRRRPRPGPSPRRSGRAEPPVTAVGGGSSPAATRSSSRAPGRPAATPPLRRPSGPRAQLHDEAGGAEQRARRRR